MQEDFECIFGIVDWHALTSEYQNVDEIKQNVFDIAIDWLAVGLDPEKSTLMIQSMVPEHAELHLLFSMFKPIPWLERVPTYKEQIVQLKEKDLSTYGFLGYPVLQAADIIMYKADGVPVGIDQVPHVEITREIARRFNNLEALQREMNRDSRKGYIARRITVTKPDGKDLSHVAWIDVEQMNKLEKIAQTIYDENEELMDVLSAILVERTVKNIQKIPDQETKSEIKVKKIVSK